MKESLDEIERVFLALSDKTRLRLVHLMSNGEVSVNYLCESLNISQPKVSRHLAYLRSMGIVNTRRDGKWIFYSLSGPTSPFGSQLFRDTLNWIRSMSDDQVTELPVSQYLAEKSQTAALNEDIDIYGNADMWKSREEMEVYLL